MISGLSAGLLVLLCGCTTNRITSITPRHAVRTPDNLYRIEARWDSNQRSIRNDSFQPYVVIGLDFHPMERTPNTVNRWETVIEVPPQQRLINYRFRFDYLYSAIPIPRADSKMSKTYQLTVIE